MLSELEVLKDVCGRLGKARIDYMESELQMRDVRNLLSSDVDMAYLRQWAPTLGVSELLEDCLRERYEP